MAAGVAFVVHLGSPAASSGVAGELVRQSVCPGGRLVPVIGTPPKLATKPFTLLYNTITVKYCTLQEGGRKFMSYVAATYKIRQDQSDKIKKISEITKISQAEIVRQALDDFLARNEDIILAQKPIFARVADERQD